MGINYNLEKTSSTVYDTIETRLKAVRNTTYVLMDTGVHGINSVKPPVSLHIYNIYVLPKVIYSLEYLGIGTAHRSLLHNIQTLPQRTALPALYIPLGTLPIQAVIKQRQMSRIPLLAENDTIMEVIARQIATKNQNSHSCVIEMQKLLHKHSPRKHPTNHRVQHQQKGVERNSQKDGSYLLEKEV